MIHLVTSIILVGLLLIVMMLWGIVGYFYWRRHNAFACLNAADVSASSGDLERAKVLVLRASRIHRSLCNSKALQQIYQKLLEGQLPDRNEFRLAIVAAMATEPSRWELLAKSARAQGILLLVTTFVFLATYAWAEMRNPAGG